MEVTVSLTSLISLASLAQRVHSEIELAKELRTIMGELGNQEFRNAQLALEDALRSSQPRYELYNAINHWQSAASQYEAAWNNLLKEQGWWIFATAPIMNAFCPLCHPKEYKERVELEEKHVLCYAGIATTYQSLGERNNAVRYCDLFQSFMFKYLKQEELQIRYIAEERKLGRNAQDTRHYNYREALMSDLLATRKKGAIAFVQGFKMPASGLEEITDFPVCQECLEIGSKSSTLKVRM